MTKKVKTASEVLEDIKNFLSGIDETDDFELLNYAINDVLFMIEDYEEGR